MKPRISFFLGAWILCASPAMAETLTLRVGYDDYCPYTCTGPDLKGFAVDMLEQVLASKDVKIQPVVASWKRIRAMAKKGYVDLILPLRDAEALEMGIPRTRESIGSLQAAYFVHKTSSWVYKGVESLNGQVIAIMQGYTYIPPLSHYLADSSNKKNIVTLTSDQGNHRHMKMLATQRVTVVPSDRLVFWFIARQLGLGTEFKEAGHVKLPLNSGDFYIGITTRKKSLATDLAAWLDQGLAAMKQAHADRKILKKYHLDDL
ncbi:substrate-binding periplasmic protein [Oligoflexus tunisiensis]|uniref:substrate-binding periplasmic protein n=1 Tax=Oligoflexus tunisiensis TaxID=708132 RepID=UPI00114CEC99|nr:transporter substrate-binding domain-containing protein [Oligoflexus tunisiensis]